MSEINLSRRTFLKLAAGSAAAVAIDSALPKTAEAQGQNCNVAGAFDVPPQSQLTTSVNGKVEGRSVAGRNGVAGVKMNGQTNEPGGIRVDVSVTAPDGRVGSGTYRLDCGRNEATANRYTVPMRFQGTTPTGIPGGSSQPGEGVGNALVNGMENIRNGIRTEGRPVLGFVAREVGAMIPVTAIVGGIDYGVRRFVLNQANAIRPAFRDGLIVGVISRFV